MRGTYGTCWYVRHPQQGEQKAQQVERLARGLLSRFGKQPPQPLFQPGHGHAEEQRQNAARQNGQHQIHQLRGKGQNVRKPQQRHKKRHAHQRHQQGLFRVRSHPNVPFPERLRGFFFVLYPEKTSLSSSRGAAQHALYSRPWSFRLKSARHHAMAMPPAMPSAARKVCSPKCSAAGRSLETTAFMQ